VVLSAKGEVLGDIEVRLIGLPERDRSGDKFEEIAYEAIDQALNLLPQRKRGDDAHVAEYLRRAVRGAIRREWGKKAAVEIVVTRV